jgi:hypothetical protein
LQRARHEGLPLPQHARQSSAYRFATSGLDPPEFGAPPFAISMYPNINELTEHGQIVVG